MHVQLWHLPGPAWAAGIAVGVVSVLAAWWALLAGDGPLSLARVGRAALAVGAVAALSAGVLRALADSLFAVVLVAWIEVAWVVPLCAVAVAFARLRGRAVTRGARRAALAGAAVLVPAGWASLVEPYALRVERATVHLAGATPAAPLSVAVVSDLQTTRPGAYERGAIARVLAEHPDLVLVPGDLFHGTAEDYAVARPVLRELLASLSAAAPTFLVCGDCDVRADLDALARDSGVELLVNRSAALDVAGRRVVVHGLETRGAPKLALAHMERRAAEEPDAVHLLLCHHPDAVLLLGPDSHMDLCVSGHTHGGQIVLPFFGPPVTLSRVPRASAAGGLSTVAGHALYVSRGVGMERMWAPRVRFLCPPEVSVLSLE